MRYSTSKISILLIIALLSVGNTVAAGPDDASQSRFFFAGPSGTWLVDVEFPAVPGAPPPPPPFKETLTFHLLGTVSESNTLLNENSYNPAFGQGCGLIGGQLQLNCNGSDGTGVWRRTGRHTLSFSIIKFVYDGASNAHVGYLRVTGDRVRFNNNRLEINNANSLTEFLVGTDIDTAIAFPLGGADSAGRRVF